MDVKIKKSKSSTTKVGEHIACGYLITTIWTLDAIGSKHDVYRGKKFCKKFSETLKKARNEDY